MMFFSMLSAGHSITSPIGVLSNIWMRCISTVPEFIRPPGPVAHWTKDEKNAWQRYRYATDTDYRQKSQNSKERYQNRPDIKVVRKEYHKNRYANDTTYRQRALQRSAEQKVTREDLNALAQHNRNRYANDPEYRKEKIDASKRWRSIPENRKSESQRLKERYVNDPVYRERVKQNARERYWKKKFGLATGRAGTSISQDTPDTPNKSDGPDVKP